MHDFSIWQAIIDSSFIVKIVLLILFLLMVTTWAMFFFIRRTFLEVELADQEFMNVFKNESHTIQGLEKIYQSIGLYADSGSNFIFREIYGSLVKFNDELVDAKKGTVFTNFHLLEGNYLERSLVKAKDEFVLNIDRYRGTLATIANLSPFIGLFGTVIGIVHTFGALSNGGGSIELIAPGIAEALVTTAVGIGASIPASWFFNIFTARLARQKTQLQNFGMETLNVIKRLVITYQKD